MPSSVPCGRRPGLAALALLAFAGLLMAAPGAAANTLAHIQRLEELINAAGTETQVRDDCQPNHAGYYERDGKGIDRLVVCRNSIDMADVEAVWEVMAHEGTHVMQACTGGTALQDTQIPRTLRELRSLAPHYAKLLDEGYPPQHQRLEAEAFWMELQTPELVIALFEHNCGQGLRRQAP